VAPGDTLFVFARAVQGPRMPLAIIRQPVGAWPFPFVLDDSMAMGPDFKLSGFPQVVVSARISRSGNATPQAGDLIGQTGPLAPGTRGLDLIIDQVQP
jgi:cytochrome c-type biogenesis protein CcmH